MTSLEKAEAINHIADEMKAERIETIDVRQKTTVTSFMIVCTGTSDVHVNAIVDKVMEKMRDQGVKPLRSDTQGAGWLLVDFGDVVFHAMREERRQFYDLDTLWKTKEGDPNLLSEDGV